MSNKKYSLRSYQYVRPIQSIHSIHPMIILGIIFLGFIIWQILPVSYSLISFVFNIFAIGFFFKWGPIGFMRGLHLFLLSLFMVLPLFVMNFFYTETIHWWVSPVGILLMTMLSLMGATIFNFPRLISFFMINKIITPTLGHTLIIAYNALIPLQHQWMNLQFMARLRGMRGFKRIWLIFPLFVFSVRHAERGSLSLVARGINNNKRFYFRNEYKLFK